MTTMTMEQSMQVTRDSARVRRIMQEFYPFDDVAVWIIEREHLPTFVRYMPIHKIPVDDVVWLRNWLNENK